MGPTLAGSVSTSFRLFSESLLLALHRNRSESSVLVLFCRPEWHTTTKRRHRNRSPQLQFSDFSPQVSLRPVVGRPEYPLFLPKHARPPCAMIREKGINLLHSSKEPFGRIVQAPDDWRFLPNSLRSSIGGSVFSLFRFRILSSRSMQGDAVP